MILIHLSESNPGHAGRPGQVGGSAPKGDVHQFIKGIGGEYFGSSSISGKRLYHYSTDSETLAKTIQLKNKIGDKSNLVHWGDNDRVGYYVSNPNGKEAYIISRKVV